METSRTNDQIRTKLDFLLLRHVQLPTTWLITRMSCVTIQGARAPRFLLGSVLHRTFWHPVCSSKKRTSLQQTRSWRSRRRPQLELGLMRQSNCLAETTQINRSYSWDMRGNLQLKLISARPNQTNNNIADLTVLHNYFCSVVWTTATDRSNAKHVIFGGIIWALLMSVLVGSVLLEYRDGFVLNNHGKLF